NAESPALLGGVQVLVDGGRVVFERPAPDTGLLKGLWTLLPNSTRNTLWPASFAFSNALRFDALVTPPVPAPAFEGYSNEDQEAEYPAGRYELSLQTAAEAGDQGAIDSLLNRRSSAETFRMALALLVIMSAMMILMGPLGPKPPTTEELERGRQASVV